jgi:hypothetical protein
MVAPLFNSEGRKNILHYMFQNLHKLRLRAEIFQRIGNVPFDFHFALHAASLIGERRG